MNQSSTKVPFVQVMPMPPTPSSPEQSISPGWPFCCPVLVRVCVLGFITLRYESAGGRETYSYDQRDVGKVEVLAVRGVLAEQIQALLVRLAYSQSC